MSKINQINNTNELVIYLKKLRRMRHKKAKGNNIDESKRQSLTRMQRERIYKRTSGRCHICGGDLSKTKTWQADHILALAQGGGNSEDNFLPAHSLCNKYRWFYGAEEFQMILKLGVWMRSQIEKENSYVMKLAIQFMRHEAARESRQKK